MNIPINRVVVTTVLSSLIMVPRALSCAAGITELARFYIDAQMRGSEPSGYQVIRPRTGEPSAPSSRGQGHRLGGNPNVHRLLGDPPREYAGRGYIRPMVDRIWNSLPTMPKLPSCKQIYDKMELFGPNGICKTSERSHYYNLSSALIASSIAVVILAAVNFSLYGSLAFTVGSALYMMAFSTALTTASARLHIAFA